MLALVFVQATASPARTRAVTYKPPFKKGAQGGDFSNFVYSDPSSGTVGILRAYPVFNPFGCGDSKGGFVTLRVAHKVIRPIASVEIRYDNAMVDPYSFLTATVKEGDRFLGAKEVRGPMNGTGKIRVPLSLGNAEKGSTVSIEFGAEVSSACPNVDGVTAQFTRVVIHDA